MNNIPAHHDVIVYDRVPAGSYASTGIRYVVTAAPSRRGGVWVRREDGTSGTNDPMWAVAASAWRKVS